MITIAQGAKIGRLVVAFLFGFVTCYISIGINPFSTTNVEKLIPATNAVVDEQTFTSTMRELQDANPATNDHARPVTMRSSLRSTRRRHRRPLNDLQLRDSQGSRNAVGSAKEEGMILPFERTKEPREYIPGHFTDAYTYFHHYLYHFDKTSPASTADFQDLPMLHIWPNYFEAYHNHWQRYRGKEVTFMEVGVQSGGKIPLLRTYFGSGFTYVGIDINPSVKMFDDADWVNIEIGNSQDPEFWKEVRAKYPKVDLFLDDGGHTMKQQRTAMEEMLPHIQSDGVYMCEDLSTSWSPRFGGHSFQDSRNSDFMRDTMVGLVHRSMDWLNAAWIPGFVMTDKKHDPKLNDFWPDELWWKEFASSVKHIHYYNQVVVYEKGLVEQMFATKTVGHHIPNTDSGEHPKVKWLGIVERIQEKLRKHAIRHK